MQWTGDEPAPVRGRSAGNMASEEMVSTISGASRCGRDPASKWGVAPGPALFTSRCATVKAAAAFLGEDSNA